MDKILGLFVDKKNSIGGLDKVMIKDNVAVATDRIQLIEILINDVEISQLSKIKVAGKDDHFPEYKRIMPSDEDLKSDYVEVFIGPSRLMQIAEAMKRSSEKNEFGISLFVPKNSTSKPVVFKNKKATALLMPVQK